MQAPSIARSCTLSHLSRFLSLFLLSLVTLYCLFLKGERGWPLAARGTTRHAQPPPPPFTSENQAKGREEQKVVLPAFLLPFFQDISRMFQYGVGQLRRERIRGCGYSSGGREVAVLVRVLEANAFASARRERGQFPPHLGSLPPTLSVSRRRPSDVPIVARSSREERRREVGLCENGMKIGVQSFTLDSLRGSPGRLLRKIIKSYMLSLHST